ncbi:MAG TPA: homocysteine S-methyltransferase family protein [Geminicoccus sp.]|jgi:homocysteine S-methyltransferase|uniref:homocysteine S-methyltransferase family protein n=1 Tax=Geminicoccus sp. TaxID=2024832 RepID=UPI002E368192|nr:homocysteine S-methyltransferase family protein [Geminicoccus sp.]HEX2526026.1 homocysteine S-methyltransferase family protein [Geminicoccus sp.]
MPRFRHDLPQMREGLFLTDGGLETTLVFLENVPLPMFASFPLVVDEQGQERLRSYYRPYLEIARERGLGFILDTPTWRANADWAKLLGYGPTALASVNRRAVALLEAIRDEADHPAPLVISGIVGPRGDGYRPDSRMTAEDARSYHHAQIATFAETEADMVSAVTLNYAEEALGIARAAADVDLPLVLSFTVETDGRLPSGQQLRDAVATVDDATGGSPVYYMINCAHPSHFRHVLEDGGQWLDRIGGIRANASARSHAELDEATELDIGDPKALAQDYRRMRDQLRRLCVMGGCCGTDHRHLRAICEAVLPG